MMFSQVDPRRPVSSTIPPLSNNAYAPKCPVNRITRVENHVRESQNQAKSDDQPKPKPVVKSSVVLKGEMPSRMLKASLSSRDPYVQETKPREMMQKIQRPALSLHVREHRLEPSPQQV